MSDAPLKETERLRLLEACRILDTPPERAFDDLTRLAAHICDTPIALVSLVDEARQWFKSRHGLEANETPRGHAFCHHAIENGGIPLVIEDATRDPRFEENPLVTGDPHIRFYAGVPLQVGEHALGTLCVIDREVRQLTADQLEAVQALARQVVDQIDLRTNVRKLTDALERVRLLEDLLPLCAGCLKVREEEGYYQRVDAYLRDRLGAEVSHGLCPTCAEEFRSKR